MERNHRQLRQSVVGVWAPRKKANPKLTNEILQDGVWQRWRVLFTGIYKFVDLTIRKEDGSFAPCTMGLIAKVIPTIIKPIHHSGNWEGRVHVGGGLY